MSPPRLQYIKDHCLAATTAFASPIRPQITPSKRNLSDLPFCEISFSSDLPRASTRHQKSRRHWHAPSRAANIAHVPSRASNFRHAPACARVPLLTSALGDVICHVITTSSADVICHGIRWRHLPRHPLTSSATAPADVIVDQTVDFDRWLFLRVDFFNPGSFYLVFRVDFIFAVCFLHIVSLNG